jgi:hypothetical protein
MVHSILRSFSPRYTWLCSCDIRRPTQLRRTCCCGVGMADRIFDGILYICIRYGNFKNHSALVILADTSRTVAELVSAYPTAGGMYFVTKHVVPPRHVALWSWIIGWCNLLGQTAGVASLGYTVAQMIFATASMNSWFTGEAYSFTPWVISVSRLSSRTNFAEHLARPSRSLSLC